MKNAVRNIFYTDDDGDDRDNFKDALGEFDKEINLYTQNDGIELIAVLKQPQPEPHLLFLDLNMPIKNGYEVLKEIKQSEGMKTFPIIVFSTSDDALSIETTQKLGADLYIPKPYSYKALKKVIAHVLSIDWETFSATNTDFVYRAD